MADPPHQTIGRYEIRKEIGRGMMGVVYEALDPALARTIALKTIKLSFNVGTEDLDLFEERFFAEARIAARLSHPGIVVVHDVGRDPATGTLYIAMERLRGRTLAEIIKEGVGLDWRAALSIVVRIAEALHHAHGQGVVHRDLKPANIMLLPSGEPKILDFGIAKVETARTKLTSDGQFFGTPLYMSPEQAQGLALGPRSDLFSLGAVAYNLLTGHAAFAGDSIPTIMQHVVEREPFPPSHYVPSLPQGVDSMMARVLAKDPAQRYADGESLAEDIKEILGGRAPQEPLAASLPKSLFEGLASEPSPFESEAEPAPLGPIGVATRPGGNLEDEFETLVSGLIPLPDAEGPASTPPAESALPPPSPVPRRMLFLALPIAVLFFAVGAAGYLLWSSATPVVTPSPLARSSTTPPPLPATPPPSPVPDASPVPASTAGLAIDFEYPLKNGRLSVWVDGKLSLDQDLAGKLAKNLVGIKTHKGSLERTLRVAPGRHEVRVRVAWDDNVKEDTQAATFKAGSTRGLEIRLGRIRKNLDLDWK